MHGPEYLYYYMTGVYSDKSSPIFQGCKDNAFVSHGKHLRGEVGMWGKMMMRKDVSKIDLMVLAIINVVYVVI